MRLASAYRDNVARGVVDWQGKVAFLEDVNRALKFSFPTQVAPLIRRGGADRLATYFTENGFPAEAATDADALRFAAPYRAPPKIWGIGLNYAAHATDLAESRPDAPGTFMRPASTITDPGAVTALPEGIGTVTGEGEIGVILGGPQPTRGRDGARDAVWGYAPLLDLTAEGLLRANVRYLTRAKSFPGFLTFGPWITSRDLWEPAPETVVRTLLNGKVHREGTVSMMAHDPLALVDHESGTFDWEGADILQTGTPGAAPLAPGDEVTAEVVGLGAVSLRIG